MFFFVCFTSINSKSNVLFAIKVVSISSLRFGSCIYSLFIRPLQVTIKWHAFGIESQKSIIFFYLFKWLSLVTDLNITIIITIKKIEIWHIKR